MVGFFSWDIIWSSKLTVFLELRSSKTCRLSEQIMSAAKYLSIFSRQMGTTNVYLLFMEEKQTLFVESAENDILKKCSPMLIR